MSSLLQTTEPSTFGIKVITVMPGNPLRNLPRSYASLLLLDAQTGKTLAIMEGGWLTALRTGAASGFATALLARKDAHVLALFGAGMQAPMQALSIHTVRPGHWHRDRGIRLYPLFAFPTTIHDFITPTEESSGGETMHNDYG